MRITGLQFSTIDDRARISVHVIWEDCDREDFELFFETTEEHAAYLAQNADAFLVASLVPAYEYGEARISVESDICSVLRTNIEVASTYIHEWHYSDRCPLIIEADRLVDRSASALSPCGAQMFSGGIDSYATLLLNRRFLTPSHPNYTRVAILAFGLELDDPTAFEYVLDALRPAAQHLDFRLIPMFTNTYRPYRAEDAKQNWEFWIYRFMGSALASHGHAVSGICTRLSIAAGDCLVQEFNYDGGDNPLVGENLSSSRLRVHHSGAHLTRLAKLRLVAESPTMLRYLRVCNQHKLYEPDKLNCGRCEKCIRTMLALLAVGALDRSPTFPRKDIDAKLILKRVHPNDSMIISSYRELLSPLADIGRIDLVRAVKTVITRSDGKGIRPLVSKLDHRYLKGYVGKLMKTIG